MKLASRAAAAALATLVCLSGAAAVAAPSDPDAFRYGGSRVLGGAVDDSELGNTGIVEANY